MASADHGSDRHAVAGCAIARVATPQVAVGVDVGEDFLDLAVLRTNPPTLTRHRIGLRGIEDNPAQILSERLAASCPDSGPQWLALIDSPRWPRDLDLSRPTVSRRNPEPAGRSLDRALREMLRDSDDHKAMRLSMFPTPKLEYFRRCADAATYKPHLRAIYHYLFEAERPGSGISAPIDVPGTIQGGTFTRFMLAGFLTFRVFEVLGVPALEAYPDLQYRLWGGSLIAPKRQRAAALESRIEVLLQLRRTIGIAAAPLRYTLDQADAEVLALTAIIAGRQGSLAALEHPAEGRFLITFNSRDDPPGPI